MTKEKINISLWLHEGEPDGPVTWEKGSVFLSVFDLKKGERPMAKEVLAQTLTDLEDREALFILTGEDPAAALPLLYLAGGKVSDVGRQFFGLMTAKTSNFNCLLLLGSKDARVFLSAIDTALRLSGKWMLMNETPLDGPLQQKSVPADMLSTWKLLLKTARIDLPGLDESSLKTRETHEADRSRAIGTLLYLTGRGADARAKLGKNGLRILAGSRSSPLDATPSLCQPYRETVKRLVDEEKLKKIDGVWTFVEDVKMVSSVQAASILMRTAAGADNWKTNEGVPITLLCRH